MSDLHHLPLDHVESEDLVIHLMWALPSVGAAKQMILPMLLKAKLLVFICSKEMDQVHDLHDQLLLYHVQPEPLVLHLLQIIR